MSGGFQTGMNYQRLEEECRLKEGYAERVKQMTRSLDQLQKGEL